MRCERGHELKLMQTSGGNQCDRWDPAPVSGWALGDCGRAPTRAGRRAAVQREPLLRLAAGATRTMTIRATTRYIFVASR